nr:PREDICTED: BRICHOS domain-containing protein 5 isoform X2 [Lepisosteus oculatus]
MGFSTLFIGGLIFFSPVLGVQCNRGAWCSFNLFGSFTIHCLYDTVHFLRVTLVSRRLAASYLLLPDDSPCPLPDFPLALFVLCLGCWTWVRSRGDHVCAGRGQGDAPRLYSRPGARLFSLRRSQRSAAAGPRMKGCWSRSAAGPRDTQCSDRSPALQSPFPHRTLWGSVGVVLLLLAIAVSAMVLLGVKRKHPQVVRVTLEEQSGALLNHSALVDRCHEVVTYYVTSHTNLTSAVLFDMKNVRLSPYFCAMMGDFFFPSKSPPKNPFRILLNLGKISSCPQRGLSVKIVSSRPFVQVSLWDQDWWVVGSSSLHTAAVRVLSPVLQSPQLCEWGPAFLCPHYGLASCPAMRGGLFTYLHGNQPSCCGTDRELSSPLMRDT